MMLALDDDAQLVMGQVPIGYVNAHATSTPKGDQIEATVVDRVLRFHHNKKYILSDAASTTHHYMSSTKGATGHLLGAAGALEAAFTVMTLVDQMIPPTLNFNQPEDDDSNGSQPKSFRHVSGGRAIKPPTDLQLAISNSFGFGGTNASLVFRRYQDEK
jgi:3-oxoacyl-[acyl-carrier-protein] synthase II